MTAALMSVQDVVESVRAAMDSDTASLLLLDDSRTVLQPTASAGLGGRWRGAPHIRVGAGFAGSVAARNQPVVVTEVNEGSVLNPILREVGIRRLLGVPVPGRDGPLGVLHVGVLTTRDFDADDVDRLSKYAAEIGARLSERTQDDAHLAALVLQRSLLPAAPPTIPGLDVAVRYLPAEGDLGGDWYDVFQLPSGKVGLVLGDVEGHGLRSAIVMGRLRSALRAYALDHDDPAEVLHRLDRKLCHFESDITATVAYAVTEPPFDTVTVSVAGHPPPLLSRPGRPGRPVDTEPDPILGVDADLPRRSERIPLEPGWALAFYTDGLVERRGDRGVDPYGERLDAVCRAVSVDKDAETICSHVVAAGVGDAPVEDDVALVVVRRSG